MGNCAAVAGARAPNFLERTLRKPLGRLAAAVLAGALITFAAAPAAIADESAVPTTPSVAESSTETSTPDTSTTSTTSSSDTTTRSETSSPSSSSSSSAQTTTSAPSSSTSTSADTTESSKPSETSESTTAGWPPDPYVDNAGYSIDLGNGQVVVIIACAAGEPTGFSSPQFDLVDGPYQQEQDGRYWDYLVQLHDGVAPDGLQGDWTCGGPQGGGASGGGEIAPGANSADAGAWQGSNGGNAQVRYAPKEGVETGFGGTAQG